MFFQRQRRPIDYSRKQIDELITKSYEKVTDCDYSSQYSLPVYSEQKNIGDIAMPGLLKALDKHQEDIKKKKKFAISIDGNCIKQIGVIWLKRHNWDNLIGVFIGRNHFGDRACQHIIQANWKNLRFIGLHANDITEKGCRTISQADWKKLMEINIRENPIGKMGYSYIRNKFRANCQIWYDAVYRLQ